ncbi:hypothetical protein J6590_064431 [Homalodisca vitripennis]|nr:hypothetical protein J6590_064431 [Homalodisca vitripennis]
MNLHAKFQVCRSVRSQDIGNTQPTRRACERDKTVILGVILTESQNICWKRAWSLGFGEGCDAGGIGVVTALTECLLDTRWKGAWGFGEGCDAGGVCVVTELTECVFGHPMEESLITVEFDLCACTGDLDKSVMLVVSVLSWNRLSVSLDTRRKRACLVTVEFDLCGFLFFLELILYLNRLCQMCMYIGFGKFCYAGGVGFVVALTELVSGRLWEESITSMELYGYQYPLDYTRCACTGDKTAMLEEPALSWQLPRGPLDHLLEESTSETITMIRKVYGDVSMGDTQIKEWFRRFKNGRISVESDDRSGRPSTARNAEIVECVHAAINENR